MHIAHSSLVNCTVNILMVEVKLYRQVHADQARLEKSTEYLRRAKEIAALQSSRLPQPPVGFLYFGLECHRRKYIIRYGTL